MASRLLSRTKTLALTLARSPLHPSSSPIDPITTSPSLRCLYSLSSVTRAQPSDSSPAISSVLGSLKQNFGHEKTLPRWFCAKAQGVHFSQVSYSAEGKKIAEAASKLEGKQVVEPYSQVNDEVMCFSPLEALSTKTRSHGLVKESLKIKRFELSQKITFALIPLLLLTSKSPFTTSLLVFSVYWQIYGFFKEIFLDYVHHEVSRAWVLVYFKVLLLILAKDTIINFGLV